MLLVHGPLVETILDESHKQGSGASPQRVTHHLDVEACIQQAVQALADPEHIQDSLGSHKHA
jgi:hypothetical protein